MKLSFALFLLILFVFMVGLASAQSYTAGDSVPIRYPESGMGYCIPFETPKFVRYTLYNPSNQIIWETDHELTYLHDRGWGLGWDWYDEHFIKVPGFAEVGTWKITGGVYNEFLWIIQLPDLLPLEKEFTVVETDLFDNLLAPHYISIDMGPTSGRLNFALPISLYLIAIIIVSPIFLYFGIRAFINVLEVENRGNTHVKRKKKKATR